MNTQFVDALHTRVARLRLLAYNDALAMLVAVTITTELSPTGVVSHRQSAQSIPAQEYMPHTLISQLVVEGILVLWTTGQLLKELVDIGPAVFGMLFGKGGAGPVIEYFQDPFNFVDAVHAPLPGCLPGCLLGCLLWCLLLCTMRLVGTWVGDRGAHLLTLSAPTACVLCACVQIRFTLFFSAVATRIRLVADTQRDVPLNTQEFVDTESVTNLAGAFDLISACVTICSLMSTIQYFELTERTNMLKGTLTKTIIAMSVFVPVFLLFFCFYAFAGMLLFGRTLEDFSDYKSAIHSSFEMMNANVPFEDLLAGTEATVVAYFTAGFYYYSFIAIHFVILLNVIIAIVCDAYMEVQEERNAVVARTFRNNLGSLSGDLLNIAWRKFTTVWLVVWARLNPLALLKKKTTFIEWDDDTWLEILETIIERRKVKGLPSRGTTLANLAREIKKYDEEHGIKYRTIAERIANQSATSMLTGLGTGLDAMRSPTRTRRRGATRTSSNVGSVEATSATADGARTPSPPLGESPTGTRSPPPGTFEAIPTEGAPARPTIPKVNLPPSFARGRSTSHFEFESVRDSARDSTRDSARNILEGPPPGSAGHVKGLAGDATFRQVVTHFYHRSYWVNPSDLTAPFDEEAQPPHDSWQDITLEKMAVQVNRLDRVSITSAITMRHTTEMAGEVSIVRNSRAQRLSAKNFKSVAS